MIYAFGNYTLDTRCFELRRSGQIVTLRAKVFHLLSHLLEHRDRVISKQELFDALWPQQHVSDATLDACIAEARRAIGDSGQTQHTIRTQRGHGYRFITAVETHHPFDSTTIPYAEMSPALPLASERLNFLAAVERAPNEESSNRSYAPEPWSPSVVLTPSPSGERKSITILACALCNADDLANRLSLDAWYGLAQRFFALARHVAQRYEGVIHHVGNGDFQACFGAPIAHEDHAYRAILAAFDVQRYLQQHGDAFRDGESDVAASIGLHSGQVIVGPVGDDLAQMPLPVGNVVQIAEALRRLSPPDAILLSDATRQLLQGAPRLEIAPWSPDPEIPLPVQAHQAREVLFAASSRQRQRKLSPFVGRQREMTTLQALYADAARGYGQVVGVMGEPGMGKTRLLHEFCEDLERDGRQYVVGHCHAYGQATPYLPLRDLLYHACAIGEADSAPHMRDKVDGGLRRMGLTPEPLAPHLHHLLGLADSNETLLTLPPQTLRSQTFDALLQVFIHWSRREPLVIVIENLHWIDPTSEAWLSILVEHLVGMPVLLLLSYRPGYRPSWMEKSYATQLALRRLPEAESRQVIQAILPLDEAPDALVQHILSKGDGNPFFLEELARTVAEQPGQPPTLTIPDTVQAVLAARIDRLPADAKRLLQVAAVIGRKIPASLLQAVAELPNPIYHQSLTHLQAAEFLYDSHRFPESEYTFKHSLTQEVAYESLLQQRRCALHTHIVAALEQLAHDRDALQLERLAYHAWHGGVWDKAVSYCRQVGVNAMARSAYREAKVSFEQALQALDGLSPTRDTQELGIDLRFELLSALRPFGEGGRMLEHLYEAERLATSLGDANRLGRVSNFLCVHFYLAGVYPRAIVHGERTLSMATTAGDLGLRMLATHYLGFIHWAQGDYRQAIDRLQDSLELLHGEQSHERFGQVALPSTGTRSYLARCHGELGDFAAGIAIGKEALAIAEASALPISIVYACIGLSLPLLRQGDIWGARVLLERAAQLCREMDAPLYFLMPAGPLGSVYTLLGQTADAIAVLQQALQHSASLAGLGSAHWAHCLIAFGEAYMQSHALAKAHDYASQALEHAQTHQERGYEAYALKLQADIASCVAHPHLERANILYGQALTIADSLGMQPLAAHCHAGLGNVFNAAGDHLQARAHHQAASDLYHTLGMARWLPPM